MIKTLLLITFFAAQGMASFAAQSSNCAAPRFSSAERQQINPNRINQNAFSTAVTKATNYYRCRDGLSALRDTKSLLRVSNDLTKRMARRNQLFHDPKLAPRYARQRVKTKIFGENIARDFRLNYNDRMFIERDPKACVYEYFDDRTPVPDHSYASLALRMVKLWYESPEHRVIMMDPRFRRVGSSLGYSSRTPKLCGRYYVTQNLAS